MSSEFTYFDTHAHYNLEDFNEDLFEVTERIRAAGVLRDAVIGIDLPSSERAVELAKADPCRFAVVGIHPSHVAKASKWDLMKIRNLAGLDVRIKENRVKGIPGQVAAVGEIGLDYHAGSQRVPDGGHILEKEEFRALQKEYFLEQLKIAEDAGLPVVIHSREAAQDTYDILKQEKDKLHGGVIHCYSSSVEMARLFTGLGFYLGFGGKVTDPAAKNPRKVVEEIPLSMIVLETDCPYVRPVGWDKKRNDSGSLSIIADAIAEIKGITREEVCRVTWENACRLYRISPEMP
jgi:TatD DNase family protein